MFNGNIGPIVHCFRDMAT